MDAFVRNDLAVPLVLEVPRVLRVRTSRRRVRVARGERHIIDRFAAVVQGFGRWSWTARWTCQVPRCPAAARFLWLGDVGSMRARAAPATASTPSKSFQPTASSQSDSFRSSSALLLHCAPQLHCKSISCKNIASVQRVMHAVHRSCTMRGTFLDTIMTVMPPQWWSYVVPARAPPPAPPPPPPPPWWQELPLPLLLLLPPLTLSLSLYVRTYVRTFAPLPPLDPPPSLPPLRPLSPIHPLPP